MTGLLCTARAVSPIWCIRRWCPLWTPSKLPIVMAIGSCASTVVVYSILFCEVPSAFCSILFLNTLQCTASHHILDAGSSLLLQDIDPFLLPYHSLAIVPQPIHASNNDSHSADVRYDRLTNASNIKPFNM